MKKIYIVTLAFILVAVGGFIYYKNWRRDFIRKEIPNLVFLKSDSLYRITYDSVYIDEVAGEIIIQNLLLQPDSTYRKASDSTLPKNLLQVSVPELHVTGVRTDAALLDKEITAGRITLKQPVVTMFNTGNDAAEQEQNADSASGTSTRYDIYRILLRGLEQISVDTIIITGADYHICKWEKEDTVFSGRNINAQLYNLNISDSTSMDTSRVLFAKQADVTVEKIRINEKKRRYRFMLNDIKLLSAEKKFALKSFFIEPVLGEAAFMKAAKWQTDRLNFDFTGITFNGMDIPALLEGNLEAEGLVIRNASCKLFRDKSYPMRLISKVGQYPQQLLTGIPFKLAIKKMSVQHGFIEYKEKNPKTDRSGLVQFNDVQATFFNVTNRRKEISANNICVVHFSSRFLDKVPLKATLRLQLGSKEGKFSVEGRMGPVDAPFFNVLTKPMAKMEIKKGEVNRLAFTLHCTNYYGKGTVTLLYDDLKVAVLESEDGELDKKTLASLLANVMIKNSNPAGKKPVRVATVNYKRDIYRSMFALIWKAIFEGIAKSVGIEGKLPV
jgi:hypothetical protein